VIVRQTESAAGAHKTAAARVAAQQQFYLLLENIRNAADFNKLNFGFIAARLED